MDAYDWQTNTTEVVEGYEGGGIPTAVERESKDLITRAGVIYWRKRIRIRRSGQQCCLSLNEGKL